MRFIKKRVCLFLTFIFVATLIIPSKVSYALTPFNGNLEVPILNSSVSGNTINIEGWAVHSSKVKEINVKLDGVYKGKARYGKERNDVYAVFPQYSDSKKSGFTYEMSLRNINNGNHRIDIEVVAQNGSKGYLSTSFTKTNLPPKMWTELPTNNSTAESYLAKVCGWALNPSGVKEIKIYLNDNLKGTVNANLPRKDIGYIYPDYDNAQNSGFSYDLNLNQGIEGTNKITAEVIGQDGSKQKQDTYVKYKKRDSKMCIEQPLDGSMIENSSAKVSGWALNATGIKEVKVYLNDKIKGSANINIPREDISKTYQGYPNSEKSGFSYDLNLDDGINGTNKITVEAIGEDGSKQKQDANVKFAKKDPKMWLEAPENNRIVGQDVLDVYGWALDQSGIKEVKVLLDGSYIGSAKKDVQRSDVDKIFPGYANGKNPGFSYKISLSNVSYGKHTISVQVVGNSGKVQTQESSIMVKNLENRMWVEEPSNNAEIKNNFKITGWALNQSGVKEINIYADEKFIGKAQYGLERNDINSFYPEYYESKKSGFSYDMSTDAIESGTHDITVEVVGNNNTKESSKFKINVVKKDMKMNAETLYENMNVSSGTLKVEGWVLSDSLIKDVKIYVDDSLNGNANINVPREDVDKIYPGYKNGKTCGFIYNLNASILSAGKHKIRVIATSVDGKYIERSNNINIIKADNITYKNYNQTLDFYTRIQVNSNSQTTYSGNSTWRKATYDEIKYQMNPENFINDSVKKFIFYKLNYTEGITAEQLNQVLVGKGVLQGKGQAFLEAGRRYNVNPVYLVAHSILETGNGTSRLSKGIVVNALYKKQTIKDETGNNITVKVKEKDVPSRLTFNVYGIGAFDDDANFWGADRAYREGWFSIEDAIIGGAKWIAEGYISKGQDTLYKMRWDFQSMTMWHQYATDIEWATKQTDRIKRLVDQMSNPTLHFEIPIFKK